MLEIWMKVVSHANKLSLDASSIKKNINSIRNYLNYPPPPHRKKSNIGRLAYTCTATVSH